MLDVTSSPGSWVGEILDDEDDEEEESNLVDLFDGSESNMPNSCHHLTHTKQSTK